MNPTELHALTVPRGRLRRHLILSRMIRDQPQSLQQNLLSRPVCQRRLDIGCDVDRRNAAQRLVAWSG
jgi:hypothetical protein